MANLRAALHSAAGAPRLFRAARRAGAGRIAAMRLLATSGVVLFVVAPQAAGVPGRQNAVRHFVWQALLTARYGETIARAVAEEQEHGSTQPQDSAVDARNNAAAQDYGRVHAADLASRSSRSAMRELLRVGLAKWEAGELSGGRAAARADGRRRRGLRGRANRRMPS